LPVVNKFSDVFFEGLTVVPLDCDIEFVISRPYTKESVGMAKRRLSHRPRSDEITTRGYRALTFAKCTTIMIAKLVMTSGLGSSVE
jgi:hypothetical protein